MLHKQKLCLNTDSAWKIPLQKPIESPVHAENARLAVHSGPGQWAWCCQSPRAQLSWVHWHLRRQDNRCNKCSFAPEIFYSSAMRRSPQAHARSTIELAAAAPCFLVQQLPGAMAWSELHLLVRGEGVQTYLRPKRWIYHWREGHKEIREELLKTKLLWILSLLSWTEDRPWKSLCLPLTNEISLL